MPFVNPLDKLPQVPKDWANHVVWGGALGLALLGAFAALELSNPAALSTNAVLAVAGVKKAVDYFREGESIEACVGKAFITAAWPASIALVAAGSA